MRKQLVGFGLALFTGVAASFSSAEGALPNFKIMVPNSTTSSWQVLAEAVASTLQKEGLAGKVEVYNVVGDGGAVGLKTLHAMGGDSHQLMAFGLGALGSVAYFKSEKTFRDVTPIARLTSDFETVVVPSNSPYKGFADVVNAIKTNPGSVRWSGSQLGGTAHMVAGMIANTMGVDPGKLKYVPSSGNEKALKAMLQGELDVTIGQYSSFDQYIKEGKVRPLAITQGQRETRFDIPTLKEQGVDLEFLNWRGIVAPPNLAPAEKAKIQLMFSKMVRSVTWQKALQENNWNSYYKSGEPFRSFIDNETSNVTNLLNSFELTK